VSRSIVSLLAMLAVVSAAGSAAAAAPASRPSASASAVAIRVVVPGRHAAATPEASARSGAAALASFSYPADGSVIVSGASRASQATSVAGSASARASSGVVDLSLFDGEITASSIAVVASSATTRGKAAGTLADAGVANLDVLGRSIGKGTVALGWGTLTVDKRSLQTAAPPGVKAYNGSITGLDVVLSAAHGGLPAGSEIEIATAQVATASAPPVRPRPPQQPQSLAVPGDRPQLLPATTGPLLGVPQEITPPLAAGPYVFPVYGGSSYGDDYGSLVPGVDYEHGIEIFGALGQPLVAAASGTLYAVGWSRAGGNRLWLRDAQGNEFYYARLSAFSPLVADGAHVAAGQVIGFMGATGNVQGRTYLEFEVHPVSLLYLGSQGAVDPDSYLAAWRRVRSIALAPGPAWAPSVPETLPAPEPGAVLVSSSDIAGAPGLDPAGLRRTLGPPATVSRGRSMRSSSALRSPRRPRPGRG